MRGSLRAFRSFNPPPEVIEIGPGTVLAGTRLSPSDLESVTPVGHFFPPKRFVKGLGQEAGGKGQVTGQLLLTQDEEALVILRPLHSVTACGSDRLLLPAWAP